MADIKELIGLAALGVGAYFVYEMFFAVAPATTTAGGVTPPPTTTGGGSAAGGAGTAPAKNTATSGSGAGTSLWPANPPYPLGPSGPCSPQGVLSPILSLAQKANPSMNLGPTGTDTFTMDQWNFYANQQCSGLATQAGLDPNNVFPGDDNRGGPLNWNAWAGFAKGQGLSGPRRRSPIGSNIVVRYKQSRYARRAA